MEDTQKDIYTHSLVGVNINTDNELAIFQLEMYPQIGK